MFKNYFKTAWKNLLRNKVYSFINITGLSIGLACCMLIILYNKDAASYDAIACYYLISPEAFTFELTNIAVNSQTGCTTIAVDIIDEDKEPPEKFAVNLATSLCKTSYFNYLLSVLR